MQYINRRIFPHRCTSRCYDIQRVTRNAGVRITKTTILFLRFKAVMYRWDEDTKKYVDLLAAVLHKACQPLLFHLLPSKSGELSPVHGIREQLQREHNQEEKQGRLSTRSSILKNRSRWRPFVFSITLVHMCIKACNSIKLDSVNISNTNRATQCCGLRCDK